jgi:hypothetical protein
MWFVITSLRSHANTILCLQSLTLSDELIYGRTAELWAIYGGERGSGDCAHIPELREAIVFCRWTAVSHLAWVVQESQSLDATVTRNWKNWGTPCAWHLAVYVYWARRNSYSCRHWYSPRKASTWCYVHSMVLVWSPVSGLTKEMEWFTVWCMWPRDPISQYAAQESIDGRSAGFDPGTYDVRQCVGSSVQYRKKECSTRLTFTTHWP